MSTTIPASKYPGTLTGFDEIAIANQFGCEWTTLEDKPIKLLRALAFVDHRRNGLRDKDAYQAVMELTIAQVNDYFPDEEEEPVPVDLEGDQEDPKDE